MLNKPASIAPWRIVLLAVVSASTVAACSSSGSSGSTSSSGGASSSGGSSAKAIPIAVMAPITGTASQEGENAKNAGSLAVKAIAATGVKLSVSYYDTKGDPAQAANIAQKLTTDYQSGKLAGVVGPAHSDEAAAALPIFSRAGVPVIGTTPSNPDLTKHGYKDFIRMVPSDSGQSIQQVAFAYNNLKKRRFGIFYENNDFGQGLKGYQVDAIKADATGASVVDTETYVPSQTRDFSTQLTKMMKAKPDVILMDTGYTEGGLILRQATQLGLKTTWVGSGNNLYQDYINLAKGAAENTYVLTSFNQFSTDPATVTFLADYRKQFKSLPAEGAYTTYDALHLIANLTTAGTKPSGLIAAAKAKTFTGVGGAYNWTAQGDANLPLAVDIVKNKAFVDAKVKVTLTGFGG